MKRKLVTLSLFLITAIQGYGQAGTEGMICGIAHRAEVRYTSLYTYDDPNKRKARICLISGTVLSGSGALVALFSNLFLSGARERDPVKFKQIENDRRTGTIVGAGMAVAGIPLLVLGRYYQGQERRRLVLQLKSDPFYDYKGNAALSVGLGLNWHL